MVRKDASANEMMEEAVELAVGRTRAIYDAMIVAAGDHAFGLKAASLEDRLTDWLSWSTLPDGSGWESQIQAAMARTGWGRDAAEEYAWDVETRYRVSLAQYGDWDETDGDFDAALLRGKTALDGVRMLEAGREAARNLTKLRELRNLPAAQIGPDLTPVDVAGAYVPQTEEPDLSADAELDAGAALASPDPVPSEGVLAGPPPDPRDTSYNAWREDRQRVG